MARDELTTAYLNELYILKVIMFKPHHSKVESAVSIFYRMIRNYEGSVNMHYLIHMFRTQFYLLPNILNNNY